MKKLNDLILNTLIPSSPHSFASALRDARTHWDRLVGIQFFPKKLQFGEILKNALRTLFKRMN